MPKMPQSSPLHTSSNHTIAAAPRAERSGEAVLSTIRQMAAELGFAHIGVASIDLQSAESGLLAWLAAGFHGDMHYMAAHGLKRAGMDVADLLAMFEKTRGEQVSDDALLLG